MNLELNEYLDKIKNDLYFSECVEDYIENKSVEGMMNICKILEYRSFFIGIYFNIMDKKILKQKTCLVDLRRRWGEQQLIH